MSRRSRKKTSPLAILIVLVLCGIGGAAANFFGLFSELDILTGASPLSNVPESFAKAAQIYYIDVGQGDSQLIRLNPDDSDPYDILIDAGTRSTKQELSAYLSELGVQNIDLLIGTHPHEDHIGGMAQIIEDFPIGTICLPETSEKMTPTTKTYESLLDAIEEKDVPVTAAKAGTFLLKTDEVTLQILSPSHQDYDNLNDYSIVTRLVVGEKSFLFEGDAEAEVEQEILDTGYDVSCDVLKLGHHGSSTSSSAAYLKAANPEFAVISCGVDNDYGHPHRETMERLQKLSIQEYRTDKQKTLLAETDGKTIQWTTGLHSVIDAA